MICPTQTQSTESNKAYVSCGGKATVRCPFCEKCHYTRVPKSLNNKQVKATCECGKSFPVLFDSRKYFRKEVNLPGEYWGISGGKDLMTVTTLSVCGASFEVGRRMPFINSGETIQVNFSLNNSDNTWINSKAVVRRVNDNQIGVEFIGMDDYQRKCIGFYLMP